MAVALGKRGGEVPALRRREDVEVARIAPTLTVVLDQRAQPDRVRQPDRVGERRAIELLGALQRIARRVAIAGRGGKVTDMAQAMRQFRRFGRCVGRGAVERQRGTGIAALARGPRPGDQRLGDRAQRAIPPAASTARVTSSLAVAVIGAIWTGFSIPISIGPIVASPPSSRSNFAEMLAD